VENQAGFAPFTRISVFDADAVSLRVDGELGYVYTPGELALFSHVSSGLQRVQQLIAAEVARLRPGTNTLLPLFAKGSAAYPVIESLGATTAMADLAALADVPEDAEEVQARLQEEVAALRSNTLDAVPGKAEQVRRGLARAQEVLGVVASFDATAYEAARDALEQTTVRRRQVREELFSADELAGPPDEEWQRFVVAGDRYRAHLGLEGYPQAADSCLYCRQALAQDALELVSRYRVFLDETLVQQTAAAGRAVEAARLPLDEADVQQVLDGVAASVVTGPAPEWTADLAEVLEDALHVAARTAQNQEPADAGVSGRARALLTPVTAALQDADEQVAKLAGDKANAGTLLEGKQRELAARTARLDLRRHLSAAQSSSPVPGGDAGTVRAALYRDPPCGGWHELIGLVSVLNLQTGRGDIRGSAVSQRSGRLDSHLT
jgi:hypothetical protein